MRVYLDPKFTDLGLKFAAPRHGDAGYDLFSLEAVTLAPGQRAMLPTGIHLEIPIGYVGIIRERSSMGVAGLHTLGGVIDASYRGEVKLILLNVGDQPYSIDQGQKVAQLLILPCFTQAPVIVPDLANLTPTERGSGGFGSTGS